MFNIGEAVICVDASALPEPWKPLENGKIYTIRSIEKVDLSMLNKNTVHSQSPYMVRLEEIINVIHPKYGSEITYASTRFEKLLDTLIKNKDYEKEEA
jgi:hypothetical protein